MKTKFIVSLITALLFNALTSGAFASVLGVSHGTMFALQMGLSLIPLNLSGCLAEGLNREIWIPEIIEKFYPSDSFLAHSKSWMPGWTTTNCTCRRPAWIRRCISTMNCTRFLS